MRAIRVLALVLITVGAPLWVATCGGDGGTTPTPTTPPTPPTPPPPANRAPTATGSIEAQTIPAGESVTVDVASNFTDPDGNTLSFAAASSDDAVATASVSGSNVTITGVSAGTATVTVTASDPGGLSATQSISVTVEAVNQAPVAEGTIDDLGLVVGAQATVDVTESFSDPDDDELTYAAASSDTTVATVATDGAMVTVTAVAPGSATVTVTASDAGMLSASQEFGVTVEEANEPPVAEGTIDDQTVDAGSSVEVDVSANFSDPDDDELTFGATSSDEAVATVATEGAVVTVTGVAEGSATVTVTASDAGMLSASLEFGVTVTPPPVPPEIVDTIPTHDMIVDSMVVLDVSSYFEQEDSDLTYSAATSDEAVAVASVDGSRVTTTGTGAVEDSISVAMLSVTATNEDGLSVTQDSIMVRVHQEEYDSLPGIAVSEDGTLLAQLSAGAPPLPLSICLQIRNFPVGGTSFSVFWSEWQRAVGSGWVVAQDNNEAHRGGTTHDPSNPAGSVCPINIDDESFPPGIYRLVGHVQIGEDTGYYKTNTFEKPEG
ncbi:MAG: Ig-like domain-containing protein [Gammaproteobacteria bacterium]|nr:Ig-like domain-containing protein [Gammaproteobacteria bacterium]